MNGIQATLCGRITKQGVKAFQASGRQSCSFSVAVTPRVKTQGSWGNGPTMFVRVTVWDQYLAGHVLNSVQAGDNVMVCGEITTSEYQDSTRYEMTAEAVAVDLKWNDVQVLGQQQEPQQQGYETEPQF